MKPKLQRHVQTRGSAPHRNAPVSREIQTFLRAVDSYPGRVAKEPGLTFHRHLARLFNSNHKTPGRN